MLVCDDDPCVIAVVGEMLARQAYGLIAADSGQQALELAVAHHPDVILLDLLMPGMSGWETAAALQQHAETRDIPVVILSVLTPAEADAPAGQFADWLQKPLDDEQLVAALQRAAGRHGRPMKVLVVEDDLDLAAVLTATFERRGIRTFHAADGAGAIELCQRLLPDLLVLDIGLPEVDGFEVVEWLRRHERLRTVPLVVYTGSDLDGRDRERLRLGSTTEFLSKARITPLEFEQRVMSLLRQLTRPDGAEHR